MPTKALEQFTRQALIRADESDGESVTAIISTEDVARDDAIIEQAGWEFETYRENPVVLFMHDDRRPPIARSTDETVDGKRTTATARFDLQDPFAAEIAGKVERGLINTTSVRWNPIEWEWRDKESGEVTDPPDYFDEEDRQSKVLVFTRQELLEWSFVTVPADPGAKILRSDGEPICMGDYCPTEERIETILDAAYRHIIERTDPYDDESRRAVTRLYGALTDVVQPGPQPDAARELEPVIDLLIDTLREATEALITAQRRPKFDQQHLIAEAIAHATGRSVEAVEALMSGRNSA